MEKVYIICWARALGGDGMPVDASAGSDGVYLNREQALKALTKSKDEWISVIYENTEDVEDKDLISKSLQVYGSEAEEFYEIDYTAPDDTSVEVHITLLEADLVTEEEPE